MVLMSGKHRHDPRDPEAEPCCPECCDCAYAVDEVEETQPQFDTPMVDSHLPLVYINDMNTSSTPAAPKAVRTFSGNMIHQADGSQTNCGLHLKRFQVVKIEQVAPEFKCVKCYRNLKG